MIGIIILFIIWGWFFISGILAKALTYKMQWGVKRIFIFIILWIAIFIGPVADEIIGKEQMEFLYCNTENMLVYDEDKVRGKSLQYKFVPRKKINKILVIKEISSEWVDPKTGEVFITHRMYYARGGWLSKLISAGKPLTFSDHCSPKGYYELFKKLDVKELDGRYGEE